jgi:hypothetical protein
MARKNLMNLKSFGCSFIFGSELADNQEAANNRRSQFSQLTWPAHLANSIKCEYNCYARPGSGNLQILEQVLNQASVSNNSDLFVIGWTWIDRFDYYNSGSKTPWSTITPTTESTVAETYYKEMHSEYRDKFTCLSYIKLAIDTLNQKNIPFIMTYMDELLFDERWNTSFAVVDLQKYVKPYTTTFEDKTFLDWSRSHGYPETPQWHPLEAAHRAAGDYIIKVFDKKNTVGLVQPALF